MANLAIGRVAAPPELRETKRELVPVDAAVKTVWERFVDRLELMTQSSLFQGTIAILGVTVIGLTLLFLLASNPVGWLATAFALSYVAAKVIFIVGVFVAEALLLIGPFIVFDNQSKHKPEISDKRYVIASKHSLDNRHPELSRADRAPL